MKKTIKICLISTFLIFIAKGAWAMLEGEEQSSIPFTTTKTQQSKLKVVDPVDILPGDLLINISVFLEANDLGKLPQLSKKWKAAVDKPNLWEGFALIKYRDYLSQEDLTENPKQKVIQHYLSVLVNTKENLNLIENLVNYYKLNSYVPFFKKYITPLIIIFLRKDCYGKIKYPLVYEELIAQDSKEALTLKLQLELERIGYSRNYTRPIYGRKTIPGIHTDIDPKARIFCNINEMLVEMGDPSAIRRKIWGLEKGECIVFPQRSMHPECYNSFGYMRSSEKAREFIEELFKNRNSIGIEIKIEGLMYGEHKYETNPSAAKELNDSLIEEGNQDAIRRKIEGLMEGKYGYEKNPIVARKFNESLVEKEDQEAINRKIEGFNLGQYGYERNPEVARELNDILVKKDDPNAIKRKIEGFANERYGYKKNPEAAREFIEALLVSKIPTIRAIGKYIKAFAQKYGILELGYEKEYEEAINFIKKYQIPY